MVSAKGLPVPAHRHDFLQLWQVHKRANTVADFGLQASPHFFCVLSFRFGRISLGVWSSSAPLGFFKSQARTMPAASAVEILRRKSIFIFVVGGFFHQG
jgi:hypothetical protein